MFGRLIAATGLALIFLSAPCSAGAAAYSPWVPEASDSFVVDVSNNIGYLVHTDGSFMSFLVATGQKETVHYIGRTYKANTPIRTWTVEQKQIKGDRRTFGVTGRFLRLYRGGDDSPYGIHSYYKVDEWMTDNYRYRSMGCIVVTEQMLDIIEQTYDLAGKNFTVITTADIQTELEKHISATEGPGI